MADKQPHGMEGGFRESVKKPKMLGGNPRMLMTEYLEKRRKGKMMFDN